jgi:hypothetical protein
MALSYNKAQAALDRALDHFKLVLPYETIRTARKRGATDIYEILPAVQFQVYFDQYWNSFFKLHHTTIIRTCPAFVTPEPDPGKRKIYIKDDGNTKTHTLYHEVIHYLQHPNFYPKFYEVAGQNPYLLEGVTEFFTRELDTEITRKRVRDKKYQPNFLTVDSWSKAASERRDQLVAYSFQGDKVDLASIGAVMPVGM